MNRKRIPAAALVLTLFLVLCPMSTAAAASDRWDGTVDISWYDPEKADYSIGTPAQLAGLAALVNGMVDEETTGDRIVGDRSFIHTTLYENQMLVGAGGGNVFDNLYVSATDFAGKTVHLTADLDMGGVYNAATGNWSGPNWAPIGGRYSMDIDETAGDSLVIEAWFNGVFDGGGHTIKNLYCDRYAEKGFPYSQGVGLFGCVGGADDLGELSCDFPDGWVPAVKNLVLGEGFIYGRRMVGGLVGCTGDASNGVLFEYCANLAAIQSTDSKGIGGIVGCGWSTGAMRYCYNAGDLSTTFACPGGGICASNSGLDIYNCYNVGKINTNGNQMGRGIGGHESGAYAVSNCYYLAGCGDDPKNGGWYGGASTKISVDVKELSAADMKSASFLGLINASGGAFVPDPGGVNGGYPVLYFQAAGYDGLCAVTYDAGVEGGAIAGDASGSVPYGTLLHLSASAQAGYTLQYYTVNGEPIASDFYAADGNLTIGAVFSKIREVKVSIPVNDACSVTVFRSGYKLAEGVPVAVTDELISDGDTILEGNVLAVKARAYSNVNPTDMDLEYTNAVTVTADNAVKVADGQFKVSGEGDVTVAAVRGTRNKQWTAAADTSWYTGWGDAYTLTTAEQLAGLAYLVNTGGVTFKGVTVSLGSDISLENTDGTVGERLWKPVGTSVNRAFHGIFDGQGFEITGMAVSEKGSYAALFGYCVNAEIRNVTVRGGAGSTASSAYAAGIVAFASGTAVHNCVSYAEINAAGNYAAGIAAYICDGSTVSGCVNAGSIKGCSGVGGIVGVSYSGTDSLSDCVNYGDLTAAGDSTYGTGGIAGKAAGKLLSCRNYGEIISGDRYTGGIAGYTSGKNTSRLESCYSAGKVSCSSSSPNAAAGGIAGYAQYLGMSCCMVSGTVSGSAVTQGPVLGRAGDGVTVDGGSVITASEAPYTESFQASYPAAENRTSFTAAFRADGVVVRTVAYTKGQSSVTEPAVPAKEGNVGYWEHYALGTKDIVIDAVYRPDTISGNTAITRSGTYYLDYYATGPVTVGEGLAVTLDGSLASHEGLCITAGAGSTLTLRDVALSGEHTILTLNGGSLILAGTNRITGRGEGEDNADSPVLVYGDVTLGGEGSLTVSAGLRSAAVTVAEGLAFEQTGGTLKLIKTDLLGIEGGALCAWGSDIKISGGVFTGLTSSDNVSVIAAETVRITGGTVTCVAEKAPTAIDAADVAITGGSVKIRGHTGSSDDDREGYENSHTIYHADAVNDYNGDQAGIRPSLSGDTALAALQAGWSASPEEVLVDGADYRVAGGNAMITDEASGLLGAADHTLYLYLTKKDHTVTIDGVAFGLSWNGEDFAVSSSALAVCTIEAGEYTASVTASGAGSARFMAAACDDGGKQLDFASSSIGSFTLSSASAICQFKTFALNSSAQIFDRYICKINY